MLNKLLHTLREYKYTILLLCVMLLFYGGSIAFGYSEWYSSFELFLQENIVWAALIMILVKTIGVVWPPLSPGILMFVLIPTVGWFNAFVIDWIGEMVGSVIAYWLAVRYGESFVNRVVGKRAMDTIRSIKITPGKEFEFLFIMRFIGWTLFDFICYAAGLLKVGFKPFMLSAILSYTISGLIVFKFADLFLSGGIVNYLLVSLLVLCAYIVYRHKDRYLQRVSA